MQRAEPVRLLLRRRCLLLSPRFEGRVVELAGLPDKQRRIKDDLRLERLHPFDPIFVQLWPQGTKRAIVFVVDRGIEELLQVEKRVLALFVAFNQLEGHNFAEALAAATTQEVIAL